MKINKRNCYGFTLVEMMVVLGIITILLLILIPNIAQNNMIVGGKSCEATIQLLEAQVAAYEIENGEHPTAMKDLEEYVKGDLVFRTEDDDGYYECPNGNRLTIDDEGAIIEKPIGPNQ